MVKHSESILINELFQRQGELHVVDDHRSLLLSGLENLWYVDSGKVDVFIVNLIDGKPVGDRSRLLVRRSGQCMFGMDPAGYYGFLAVCSAGTQLYRLKTSRLEEFDGHPELIEGFSAQLDNWITSLSLNLTRNMLPHPKADLNLDDSDDDDETTLEYGQIVRSNKGVLWVKAGSGQVRFIGMQEFSFAGDRMLFPLTPHTWLEAIDEQHPHLKLSVHPTVSMIYHPALWQGLGDFHELLCSCKSLEKKHFRADESYRLGGKAYYSEVAKDAALRHIASVLDTEMETPPVFGADAGDDAGSEPVFIVSKLVGEAMAIKVRNHPDISKQMNWNVQDKVNAIAKASRFRVRPVALRDDWYKRDQGPMVATIEETREPLALLPTGPTSYESVNPKNGARTPVDEETAATLNHMAFCFYRPFQDGFITLKDLIKFGARGLRQDALMLVMMGIIIGCLGALTPYFTGQIFDTVIPQAERGLLYQFSLGLVVAALAGTVFDICQGIATLRIQGKMDYSLQAALWDRLLNLPSGFFRKYSAGDLADRVSGIRKIRDLLAGTGVSAILGSLSSVFYVVLMFMYSFKLAMLALALTILFVGITFITNCIQLRHQRRALTINGALTGLGLQLITGVGKIRVSGAENFAFRRWAQDFAKHRLITITIRKIQNFLDVIVAGFPIFTSMAIYGTLVWIQSNSEGEDVLSTGDFIAFTAAYGTFQAAMMALGDASMNSLRIVPVYEGLKPIITTPAEVDELRKHPGELTGDIEVSHLHFRYDPDGPLITKNISFRIRPGEFVAFVGGSGSGKSTLMRLLMGFETPEAGTIYYDGQDLATLDLREVRRQIGVVLQESQLLPNTIFQNIVGSSSLTEADAREAAHMAGLEEDIKDMPMGMHTVVSEGGGGFSGGQRQRLMIARAIVHKPKVMFLDEATSALDNRSQAQVTESLDRLQATRIVIAHRLSTIINADQIYVLDHGEIREHGTYKELMKMNGLFAEFAKRQMA